MSYKLIANATTTVARVALTPPPENSGFNRTGLVQLVGEPRPIKALQAAGPDSSTAYAADVSFWFSIDGTSWDPTPLVLRVTNAAPQASRIIETPATVVGASLAIVSGAITNTGATNGRVGVDADVEG